MNTIIFRSQYVEALQLFSPEQRLEAYDSIMSYAFTGAMKTPSKEIAPALALICASLDSDRAKYERSRRCLRGGRDNG